MVPDTAQPGPHRQREGGGEFRLSLPQDSPTATGQTTPPHTFHAHFVRLVPDGQVVEVLEFETRIQKSRVQSSSMSASAADHEYSLLPFLT